MDALVSFGMVEVLLKVINWHSTETEYINHATMKTDFFPYASKQHEYWTGYFTSRPTLKYQSRKHHGFLQLSGRAKQHVKERQRLANALSSGVSNEGVKLYLAITKTITEVTWQGKNIVVMNQVTISPPYRPENCKPVGKGDGDAVNHVRRIMLKELWRPPPQ